MKVWYNLSASRFEWISFERGNALIAKDAFTRIEELISSMHRVTWQAISGNPACKGYDTFIETQNTKKGIHTTKHVLKDAMKDRNGIYHDCYIYEIINQNN